MGLRWRWIIAIGASLVLTAVIAGRPYKTGGDPAWYVGYHVEGASATSIPPGGYARVTYSNGQGGTVHMTEISLPWSESIGQVPSGAFLYVSETQLGRDDDSVIRVRILVNGRELRRSEVRGRHASLSASALCC
jgi:hypothetical protein